MYVCPNCHRVSESPAAFCAACGTAMVEQQPQPQAPAYTVPQPQAPAYTQPPQPQAPVYTAPQPQAPAYTQPPQPTYTAPQPQQQYWQQPVAPVTPPAEAPSKGKVIAGMVMGIAGLALAAIGVLYTLIFAAGDVGEAALGFAFIWSMFSLPLSLVGMIMSNGNIAAGDTSAMSSVGKKLGLVGLILSGVMLFIGLVMVGAI